VTRESTILLAAHRAMLDAVIEGYVPRGYREAARAAALAVGIGYEPRIARRRRRNDCAKRIGKHDRIAVRT
jgi:hypothetical protein